MFNGDMGVITEINEYTETIEVEFDESRKVKYGFDMTEELELAYAITYISHRGANIRQLSFLFCRARSFFITGICCILR